MKKPLQCFIIILTVAVSCTTQGKKEGETIITVSIAPFAFFAEKIGEGDFSINVMVPAGADPHMYEPSPAQILALRRSAAYISNGYLDFELAWLDRFYSVNPGMVKLNLADSIDLIKGKDEEHPMADPHFWVSPVSALKISDMVKNLLCSLKPENCEKYQKRWLMLNDSISKIHGKAREKMAPHAGKPVIVFHHTLAYFARDYNLRQVSIEKEGKEPSPAMLKEVIDDAKRNNIRSVIIQKEFDTRSAKVIAAETGASLRQINPLSPDWFSSVNEIIDAVYSSFNNAVK